MKLKDKVIVVTGGSGLLGKSFLQYLLNEGAVVFNFDVISSEGIFNSNFVYCDITNEISLNEALSNLIQNYQRIDGWVNNAYPRTKDWGDEFEDINYNSWKKNIDLQLNTVFLCCQKVLEIMRKQKFGSVVNIASIYGVVGPDFSIYENTEMTMPAAYSAIKGGIITFTKYLASFYGKFGVRVNCISPGGIFNNQNSNFVTNYESKVPLMRMGSPDDISPAVVFMLGDDSRYITGQNLIIDGGWTII